MMLMKILNSQVDIGMFVHQIDARWFDSPFWKTQFLITTQEEVDKFRESGIECITIDLSRGIGPPEPVPPPPISTQISRHQDEDSVAHNFENFAIAFSWRKSRSLSSNEKSAALRKARITLERSKGAVLSMFADAQSGKAINVIEMAPIVDQFASCVEDDPATILNLVQLKNKDEYTYLHSISVCALMINFARTMGLSEEIVHECGVAGLLHDVGKMAIPDEILHKPSSLTNREFDIVRKHPLKGHEMLSNSPGMSAAVLDVALHHHEKMDGSGYPHNLIGDDLELITRMAAICDVFDAVTSQRVYNKPWMASEALSRMQGWKGHFDLILLPIFIKSLGILPLGTLVRLNDKLLAIVIGNSPKDFTLPKVRVFYSIEKSAEIPTYVVEISQSIHGHHIVDIEDPASWGFTHWPTYCEEALR